MSSAIVRLKRRLEESPLEALVLHCKRVKTEDDKECSPSVFVFSGTIKDVNNTNEIKKSWFDRDHKANFLDNSKTIPDIVNKLKDEHKTAVHNNRIKIINYSRGLSLGDEDKEDKSSNAYSVLDLHHSKENSEESNPDEEYAYDVYVSQQKDFDITMLDDIVRIDPYHGELIYGSYRDNGRKSVSEDDMEDDDSNDENNWRNEYPDTDDSIQEEDMKAAMMNCNLDDVLSSDDGEEDLVYGASSSPHSKSTHGCVNPDDVDRYGLPYAKYKAKLFKSVNLELDGEPSLVDCYGEESGKYSDEEKRDSESDCAESYNKESNSENDEY